MGIRTDGSKELIALAEGLRESTESWADLLRDCHRPPRRCADLYGQPGRGVEAARPALRSSPAPRGRSATAPGRPAASPTAAGGHAGAPSESWGGALGLGSGDRRPATGDQRPGLGRVSRCPWRVRETSVVPVSGLSLGVTPQGLLQVRQCLLAGLVTPERGVHLFLDGGGHLAVLRHVRPGHRVDDRLPQHG